MENFEEKVKKFKTEFDGHDSYYSRFLLIGKIDLCKVMHCLDDMEILNSCGGAKIERYKNGEHSIYFEGSELTTNAIYSLTRNLSCRGFADSWNSDFFLAVNTGIEYSDYEMEITDDFRDNADEEETPTYDVRFKLIDPETNAIFYGGGGCLSSTTREELLYYAKGHPISKTTGCNSPYPGIKDLYSKGAEDFKNAAANFKRMLYEFYYLIWEKDHNCNREQLIFDFYMSAFGQEYETLDDYIEDVSLDVHGSRPVSYHEWLDNECKDEEIIADLLKRVHQVGLLDHYLYIRKREASLLSKTHLAKLIEMRDMLYKDGCNADEEAIEALNFAINSLSEKEAN